MATTKNLCAQIPIALHERVSEERERLGQTTSEYIANLIQDYYNMMENQKGGIQMTEKGRTMAFQIPEELFQRIKRHLERETFRTGKKLTQRDFVLNLITQALDEADAENATEQNTPTEAPVAPRVADVIAPADTDTPHEDKGQPTFRSMLEADLRAAIQDANDLGHFFLLMEHMGYEIHHGDRLGFRLRGQERFQYAGVTGDLKFRHSTLTQFHDTLSQFQLHSAALGIFLVKAPRKSHGMLTYDRTTILFFHIPTSFYVVYWLTICILTVAIFRVNENVSYKHTKLLLIAHNRRRTHG